MGEIVAIIVADPAAVGSEPQASLPALYHTKNLVEAQAFFFGKMGKALSIKTAQAAPLCPQPYITLPVLQHAQDSKVA